MRDIAIRSAALFAIVTALAFAALAQRVAVLAPAAIGSSEDYAARLDAEFARKLKTVDPDLARSAAAAIAPETPFNMTASESRDLCAAIGADFVVIVRSETISRFSLQKRQYYEAYSAIWVVSARSGRLVDFRLPSFDAGTPDEASAGLYSSIPATAAEIADRLPVIVRAEAAEPARPPMREVPDANSPESRAFRPPLPFRRISPQYPRTADLYAIAATVDIEVDVGADGKILRTEIVRWAGFGIDAEVESAVRTMQWRPGERNGKSEPVRILLRYNFKKIEKKD